MILPQSAASTPPVLKIRFFPYMSGRGRVCGSSYMAMMAATALGRAIFQAIWKVSLPPAASRTASAPRPSVRRRTSFSTSSRRGLSVTSARFCFLASSRRLSSTSMAMMRAGWYSLAHIMQQRPVGPAPITAAVSPGRISAREAPQ